MIRSTKSFGAKLILMGLLPIVALVSFYFSDRVPEERQSTTLVESAEKAADFKQYFHYKFRYESLGQTSGFGIGIQPMKTHAEWMGSLKFGWTKNHDHIEATGFFETDGLRVSIGKNSLDEKKFGSLHSFVATWTIDGALLGLVMDEHSAQTIKQMMEEIIHLTKPFPHKIQANDTNKVSLGSIHWQIKPSPLSSNVLTGMKTRFIPDGPVSSNINSSKWQWSYQQDRLFPMESEGTDHVALHSGDAPIGSYRNRCSIQLVDNKAHQMSRKPSVKHQGSEKSVERQFAQNRLDGKSLDDLIELTNAMESDLSIDEVDLARKWAAYALLFPDRSRDLAQLMMDSPDDTSFLFRKILVGLVEANHEESQAALVQVLDSITARKSRRTVLSAMALVKYPHKVLSAKALNLYKHSPNDRAMAGLVLGVFSRKTKGDASAGDELWKPLLDGLLQARNFKEKAYYLKALGNGGVPQTLSPILKILDHEKSPLLQVNGIKSLRFFSDELSLEYIHGNLAPEKDPKVIQAAIMALEFRATTSESIELLKNIALLNKVTGIRLAALNFLVKRAEPQDILGLLVELSTQERGKKIGTKAAKLLAQFSSKERGHQ